MTPLHALPFAVVGAAITALCIWQHIYSRPLGTGIGLLLIPILGALFRQRLDGPVARYRRWGVAKVCRLDLATSVDMATTRKGRPLLRTIAVSGPGDGKAARIGLGMTRQTSVRDHLSGWLLRDGVAATPIAVAALRDHIVVRPARSSRALRQMTWLMLGIGVVSVVVIAVAALVRPHPNAKPIGSTTGLDTSCTPAAPAGASPAARAFQDALNASYIGWETVTHDMEVDKIDITITEMRDQQEADTYFDKQLAQISFPSPAAATAKSLEALLEVYNTDLDAALRSGYDAVQPEIARDDQTRVALFSDLSEELGLPTSFCLTLRP